MNINIVIRQQNANIVRFLYSSDDIDINDTDRMGEVLLNVQNKTAEILKMSQGESENWKNFPLRACGKILAKLDAGEGVPEKWKVRSH